MTRESTRHTFLVALSLCLVCSFVVSLAAVSLRDRKQRNREAFRNRNVLMAAFPGELSDEASFVEFYNKRGVSGLEDFFDRFVELRAIRLSSGDAVADIDPAKYNQLLASRDPARSSELDLRSQPGRDLAGIKSREDIGVVYLVGDSRDPGGPSSESVRTIVLPIRGYGLWSTLKGFVAIDGERLASGPEGVTVRGLSYYEHRETPGLGGEIDNPAWKAKWPGRRVFDSQWAVKLNVTKSPRSEYDVDALTGATITSNGVSRMLEFWLGDDGYGPFLRRLGGAVPSDRAGTGGSGD
ncbi:MAG: NADH:ubiquinone reductase (Na(+)-transporting) subunit C [Planctomycetaceae bacterium]